MDRRVTSPIEKYETTNWSLRQGDEEVNNKIKETNTYLNKLFKQIFFYSFFTSPSPCRKDQFVVSYFSIGEVTRLSIPDASF